MVKAWMEDTLTISRVVAQMQLNSCINLPLSADCIQGAVKGCMGSVHLPWSWL